MGSHIFKNNNRCWRFVDEFCWRNTANGVPGGWPNRFKNAWEPVFHFTRAERIKFRPEAVSHESEDVVVTWCPECAKAPRYSLDDMHELAATRGGKCLSPAYVNNDTPLEWCCAKGHPWSATPNSIRPYSTKTRGSWCPVCALDDRKLTIEVMRATARERGGECLSEEYVNSRSTLQWRCAQGHVWWARPNHVRPYGPQKRGSWCPKCSGRSPREAS